MSHSVSLSCGSSVIAQRGWNMWLSILPRGIDWPYYSIIVLHCVARCASLSSRGLNWYMLVYWLCLVFSSWYPLIVVASFLRWASETTESRLYCYHVQFCVSHELWYAAYFGVVSFLLNCYDSVLWIMYHLGSCYAVTSSYGILHLYFSRKGMFSIWSFSRIDCMRCHVFEILRCSREHTCKITAVISTPVVCPSGRIHDPNSTLCLVCEHSVPD